MTESTKHDRIFLHNSEGGINKYLGTKTFDDDVEYIRADIVEKQLAAKDALLRQAREAMEQVTDRPIMSDWVNLGIEVKAIDKELGK
jgi:hypothetical protein